MQEEKKSPQSDYCKSDLTHGRIAGRYYYMVSNIADEVAPFGEWKNLKSIGFVDDFRSEKDGKITCERRYFISSLSNHAEILAEAIRGHWGIENQLNWVLDVQFQEHDSLIRTDNAPENLTVIRQIALNLLTREKTVKTGITN
nr:ISAs1 family transposase [Okeania sp. SIO2F4]